MAAIENDRGITLFISAAAVTPADNTDLTKPARALWVGTGGNVSLIAALNTDPVAINAVPNGTLLPIATKRVRATGTTASNIVALY